jgi:hypothetical protein
MKRGSPSPPLRLWFAARKLNGLYDEMVAELDEPEEFATILDEYGRIPEVICQRCQDEYERAESLGSAEPSAGTRAIS